MAHAAILLSCLHLGVFGPVEAQVRPADAVAVVGAGLVFLAPHVLGATPGTPAPCGPCDPLTVPGYDRWVLGDARPAWSVGSWLAGFAAVALPVLDLWNEGDAGRARAAAVVTSASWAVAGTELLKVAFARSRPVLYDPAVTPAERSDADNRQSFPSGHTAGAVAAATMYWWSRRALDGETRTAAWVPAGLALATGVMRITAGKHFPSDVVGGVAVGLAAALITREIRF